MERVREEEKGRDWKGSECREGGREGREENNCIPLRIPSRGILLVT